MVIGQAGERPVQLASWVLLLLATDSASGTYCPGSLVGREVGALNFAASLTLPEAFSNIDGWSQPTRLMGLRCGQASGTFKAPRSSEVSSGMSNL